MPGRGLLCPTTEPETDLHHRPPNYNTLDELLQGDNPPQAPLHQLMRDIVHKTTQEGLEPTSFERHLGGAAIIWETKEWRYSLGLTTGVPNVTHTKAGNAYPMQLVELLREHFPTLVQPADPAGAGGEQTTLSGAAADAVRLLASELVWLNSDEKLFVSFPAPGEARLMASRGWVDHAELRASEAGVRIDKDLHGRISMLCQHHQIPTL